jgi:hypothetical protein
MTQHINNILLLCIIKYTIHIYYVCIVYFIARIVKFPCLEEQI